MDLEHGFAGKDAPPRSHALRFSESFLKGVRHSDTDAALGVVYAQEHDGDILQFARSAAGAKLLSEYRDGIRRIEAKLTGGLSQTDPQATRIKRRLAVFSDRLAEGAGAGSYFSTELGLLYGYGKHAFDHIAAALDDPAAPNNLHGELIGLTEGLTVCASGVASNIAQTAERLRSSGSGLQQAARRWRAQNIDETIMKFVRAQHNYEPRYINHEIHYANAYRNALAAELHLQKRDDNIIPPTVTEASIASLRADLQLQNTPQALIEHAAGTYKSALAPLIPPGKIVYPADLHPHALEALEDATSSEFGKLAMTDVLEEHGEDAAGFPGYRQRPDGFQLERAIARNLRAAGVVQPFSRKTLCRDDISGAVVKLLGELLYVKERHTANRRRFRTPDLHHDYVLRSGEGAFVKLAVAFKNDTALATLLAHGADPMYHDDAGGTTPLHIAAGAGTGRSVELLLQAKADVNALDNAAQTPLLLAVLRGDRSIIRQLFAAGAGADVDLPNVFGESALSGALKTADDDIAVDLITRNQTKITNQRAGLLLNLAIKRCKSDTLEHLLRFGIDPREAEAHQLTPLAQAAGTNKLECIDLLLAHGAHVDQLDGFGRSALMIAAGLGHFNSVQRLLKADAQVSICTRPGESAIDLAALTGNAEVIRALLQRIEERQENVGMQSPFLTAVRQGHAEAAKLLLRAGAASAVCDQFNKNALMYAAESGHAAIIEMLAADTCPSLADADDVYSLPAAAAGGHADALQALIRHLPQTGEIRKRKLTLALLPAVRNGNANNITLLIESGADPNTRDSAGQTGLHYAAMRNDPAVLRLLLAQPIQIDVRSRVSGNTAVHEAAKSGYVENIHVLAEAGASVLLVNDSGQTPLQCARLSGQTAAVNFLIERIAAARPASRRSERKRVRQH